ncbi:MAG: putative cytokinetic ring protein SteA [Coriobacteriia bacterium]|nr:putative cytokinetic ring protein SteA [Coriobacteriia bacterium]
MEFEGVARLDRRTKDLTKRLNAGEIAIIDHRDIDRVSAEALLEAHVPVVINAAPSISGTYPNIGPAILVRGGVTLIDDVGLDIFSAIKEGTTIAIDGNEIYTGGALVARGEILTLEEVDQLMEAARENTGRLLDDFARNTIEYLEDEKDLVTSEMWVPDVKTKMWGCHVLVVVRGHHYKEDLVALLPYISEMKPVLIGVDGGADALLEVKLMPDIIIGDMDSVSDEALLSGAELIVHAYEDGYAPGMERLDELGVGTEAGAITWPLRATSEDLALLLGWELGARIIVAVGTHSNLFEYFDKGRKGMASSFLVRLKVGSKLLDAKGVNQLYRSSVSATQVFPLLLAAAGVIAVLVYISPAARALYELLILRIRFTFGF